MTQSIADVDPEGVILLGQQRPEVLLRWVYQNLGLPDEKTLDRAWLEALYRGASNSSADAPDSEFFYCLQLKRYPVDIDTFIFDRQYMNKGRDEIYDEVLVELRRINNPDGTRVVNKYTEAVFTGGIGSAKSTTALYTVAYQLYVLSCFDNPHETFGLDRASEILFVFLGMSGESADTDYDRFYAMVTASPYFRNVFPYDPRKKKELHFPHRIQVVAGINTIGQNVMGGMMDEVNFGQIVQQSKRTVEGGEYNQTLATYNGLARRRKSRFMTSGKAPGILCLVSSKRYPGEFTDVKIAESKTDPTIYIYDKRVWDMKPRGTFSSKTFQVFVGSSGKQSCVIEEDFNWEGVKEHEIVDIPVDFYKDFRDDLIGSLRDIAGVSTLARYPFIHNVNAVNQAFGKRLSVLNLEETDMVTSQIQFYPERFKDKQYPRWVHVDLGVTSDSAGIACGYVPRFDHSKEEIGPMPVFEFDFLLRARPPRNGEINFQKLRMLLTLMREHGLPIKWVSFDAFQSVDSIQMLRQVGFATGKQSMDLSNAPYMVTKTALYSNRVLAPEHKHCRLELVSLEKDNKTGVIDHPVQGSKDVSDAMAGVIYGLTMRREIWNMHRIPFSAQYSSAKEVKVSTPEIEGQR